MMEACLSLVLLGVLLLVSQLSPGPDVFFVFRTALAQGFRAGSAVGSGISAGFLIQATLVAIIKLCINQMEPSILEQLV